MTLLFKIGITLGIALFALGVCHFPLLMLEDKFEKIKKIVEKTDTIFTIIFGSGVIITIVSLFYGLIICLWRY